MWSYNWAADVGPQNNAHKPSRTYAEPGEAGLFLCTWPRSRHLGDAAVRYKNEVWTGIEYQVASHLMMNGMVDRGLNLVKAVRARYDSRVRNPFNEYEKGYWYARASQTVALPIKSFSEESP